MTIEIHGFCEERFLPMKEAFAASFDAGLELGASLALTHQGKPVVDLWAGWMDPERTHPWQRDTIVNVMSTTKIPMAIAAMRLVDRGLIDLDAPIARYWPEFAQGGKERVTVRDAFCHCAGVPAFDPPVGFEVYRNWPSATAALAATPHWFGGERRIMYHAHTYGFLLGELVRRVDGRRPAQFFREEIAAPCGIDFQMGLSDRSDMARVAHVAWPPQRGERPPGTVLARWSASLSAASAQWDLMSWEGLSAEVPAGVGLGNARSVAGIATLLATGGTLDGARYLSPEIVREAATEQAYDQCPIFGWIRFGPGAGAGHAAVSGAQLDGNALGRHRRQHDHRRSRGQRRPRLYAQQLAGRAGRWRRSPGEPDLPYTARPARDALTPARRRTKRRPCGARRTYLRMSALGRKQTLAIRPRADHRADCRPRRLRSTEHLDDRAVRDIALAALADCVGQRGGQLREVGDLGLHVEKMLRGDGLHLRA